uniref:Cadmium-induced protein AS8 n=1 Tax=Rhizophora mucronata TaxID=61149 RepID=A0A2P2JL05_RHIMU
MILKGLFRRYERWNPVHPTSGAFWGMGLGIGCGVGWGPGFGPEVIGYVGAGCGVGFSVGITLAGFGVGLPANYLFEVPYNAVLATRSGAMTFAQSSGLLSSRNFAWNGWNNVAPCFSTLQAETVGRISSLHRKVFLNKGVNFFDMKSKLLDQTRPFSEGLGSFCSRFFQSRKGEWGSGHS